MRVTVVTSNSNNNLLLQDESFEQKNRIIAANMKNRHPNSKFIRQKQKSLSTAIKNATVTSTTLAKERAHYNQHLGKKTEDFFCTLKTLTPRNPAKNKMQKKRVNKDKKLATKSTELL